MKIRKPKRYNHKELERKKELLKSHPQLSNLNNKNSWQLRRYQKEYSGEKIAAHRIIKESLKVLIFATLLSAFGGLGLEWAKEHFIVIIPLVILLPVLNGMIGNFGITFSARFTTMLYEGYVRHKWWHNINLRRLIVQIFVATIIISAMAALLAIGISSISGTPYFFAEASRILLIVLADVLLLVTIIITIAITAGIYLYDKKEDPDNFLIPITTSIADFGNMLILAVLVVLLF